MEYTHNELQLIYNNDPLHIHTDMGEDGQIILKKPLKYDFGKYPKTWECTNNRKPGTDDYNPYWNTRKWGN